MKATTLKQLQTIVNDARDISDARLAVLSLLKEETDKLGQERNNLDSKVTKKTMKLENSRKALLYMLKDIDKTSKELASAKEYTDNIIKSMIGTLIVVNSDAVIQKVNQSTLNLLGYREDELIGKPLGIIFEEEAIFNGTGIEDLIKKVCVSNAEKTYLTKDGREIPVSFSGSVMRDDKGNVLGIVCVASDITERKQAEEKEKQYIANITVLSQAAIKYVSVSPGENIYDYIRDVLRNLTGAKYIIVNSYNKTSNTLTTESFYANKTINKQITKLLGRKVVGFTMKPTDYIINNLLRKEKLQVSGGIFELSGETIPRFISCAIEKLMNIENIYVMGLAVGDELYGSAVILLRKGEVSESGYIINTFINQTSAALQHKQMEEILIESEKKYRTMLNAFPDSIVLVNLKGIITDVSEIGLELYGTFNKNDLLGKHFLRFVPSGQMIKIREIIGKTLDEGLAQNIELLLKRKNQSLFVSEISSTLIQGQGGAPILSMIIIRDISQRKKIESQFIHADRMLSLGEMTSGIAHEINQPLNTISLILDNMIEASKNNLLSKNYFIKKSEKVFENILRIKNIIDHIRVFSRSENDYIHSSFNVNKSIRNAISLISEQLKYKSIDLIFKPQKNIPSILGDTYKFEQVILNLIINAQDSLEEKKNKLPEYFPMSIKIRTFKDEQNIIVELKDNGAGIKDEDIDNIMLPFYSTKETGKGTGLGLSISFGIIKKMNGNIKIHSEVLKGTTVLITLPIEKI